MQKKKMLGAALAILIALAIMPAAVFWFHVSIVSLFALGCGLAGVTVTYQSFQVNSAGNPRPGGLYTGGTTNPTVTQAVGTDVVVALVNFGDTDTVATITHNMQITSLGLTNLQPYITWWIEALTGTAAPVLTFTATTAVVTVNHVANTGAGGTFVVVIRRG